MTDDKNARYVNIPLFVEIKAKNTTEAYALLHHMMGECMATRFRLLGWGTFDPGDEASWFEVKAGDIDDLTASEVDEACSLAWDLGLLTDD